MNKTITVMLRASTERHSKEIEVVRAPVVGDYLFSDGYTWHVSYIEMFDGGKIIAYVRSVPEAATPGRNHAADHKQPHSRPERELA